MLHSRIFTTVLVLFLCCRPIAASPSGELLGAWRWNDGSAESPVYREVRLTADHNFEFHTSGLVVLRGWWRIEHGYLLLNFWFDPGDVDVPWQVDQKLKIISVDKQHFRFIRRSEEIVAQRVK
jgi:hypothetical protein